MKLKELHESEERSILSVLGRQKITFAGHFIARDRDLTSLEGAPKTVKGYFDCRSNNITSLEWAPKYIGGNLYCQDNDLKSLKNIHKQLEYVGSGICFLRNPIKSHILGLLKIKQLDFVEFDNAEISIIMNRHLGGDRDIFACQSDLIDAGFEDFAQL